MPVGGTFGSCIQMNSPIPICAALALKARRPVKLSLTREEDMHDHTKYPSQIALKIAARKDGTLLGAEMNLVADIGAHIIQAYSFLGVCVGWMVSLYRFPICAITARPCTRTRAPRAPCRALEIPRSPLPSSR